MREVIELLCMSVLLASLVYGLFYLFVVLYDLYMFAKRAKDGEKNCVIKALKKGAKLKDVVLTCKTCGKVVHIKSSNSEIVAKCCGKRMDVALDKTAKTVLL